MGLADQPWFRRFLITAAGRKLYDSYHAMCNDLRGTQERLLARILDESKNTAFGRDHGLGAVKTVDEYRRAVPIRDFEGHRRYVERMMLGERNVLFPGKPIIYNTTSGTTDKPKMIPISRSYFDTSVTEMNRLWLYAILKDNPRIYDGKSLSAVAPAEEGTVGDGTPYGSVSGMGYRNIPSVLKSTCSFPYPVICIPDYEAKYYAMMRFAIEQDITIIISPSPSNLLRFHQTTVERFEDLVRDIRDGTLWETAAHGIPAASRSGILARLTPNPGRARTLETLMSAHGADLRPRHYWPNLACVNLWKQGNFALTIPKLDGYFPEQTALRSFGYQASEARAGLVFGNDWRHSVLAHHVYFFEFVEEFERDSVNPRTLLAHEVEQGKRYYLLFSNGSGLYRYDINDLIEIIGFYGRVPLFRFLQKGAGVTSLTGEKLTEMQVIRAASEAAHDTGAAVEHYVMCCDETEMDYKLFVEYGQGVAGDAKRRFGHRFDERLTEYNREYEGKRGSKRLAPPRVYELGRDSHEHLKMELVRRKLASAGQYKDLFLTSKPVVIEILTSLVLTG